MMKLRYGLAVLSVFITLGAIGPSRLLAANADLSVTSTCAGQGVNAQLAWTLSSASGSDVWLDVSLQNNNWQEKTFTSAGPAPAGTASASLSGLVPSRRYYVRLNAESANGQRDPSDTFFFDTPACSTPLVNSPATTSNPVTAPSLPIQSVSVPATNVPPGGYCKFANCAVDVSPGGQGSYIVPSAEYCASFPSICQANGVYWNPPEPFCQYHNCFKDLY